MYLNEISAGKTFCKHVNIKSVYDVNILASSSRLAQYLMTLEALWIDKVKPNLNTKDEYKSRKL